LLFDSSFAANRAMGRAGW